MLIWIVYIINAFSMVVHTVSKPKPAVMVLKQQVNHGTRPLCLSEPFYALSESSNFVASSHKFQSMFVKIW